MTLSIRQIHPACGLLMERDIITPCNTQIRGATMESEKFNTIDEYIRLFPAEVQSRLQEMRSVIKEAAPEAQEKISYGMPAFTLKGNLVYFAAFKKHIGFYPIPSGIAAFDQELSKYERGKGSVQFSFDQPLPVELIRRIVKFRAAENIKKAEENQAKRKKQGDH
jgi:uncharacterized protein YdhG (YjbR/CyaY superfamily)